MVGTSWSNDGHDFALDSYAMTRENCRTVLNTPSLGGLTAPDSKRFFYVHSFLPMAGQWAAIQQPSGESCQPSKCGVQVPGRPLNRGKY